MALLRTVAEKLSNNDLVAGVVQEIIYRDELFALLPFTKTDGKAYVYNRELATNDANDTSAFLTVDQIVPESSSDFQTITALLKILAGDVDVDKFLMETQSDSNDQLAIQISLKAKYLAAKFRNKLVNGDSTATNEFDGLKKLVTATGNVKLAATNGGSLSFDLLDELLDMVPNGVDALMMNSRSIRRLRVLLRTLNGNDASMIEIPNFGVPVFSYNGTPIIRNDFIGNADVAGSSGAVCSTIYALRLNEADGFHGLFGGESAGIRIENIGTVQNKDALRTRLKWYCGTALKSTKSLAALTGILPV